MVFILRGRSEGLRQPRFAHFDNTHSPDKPVPLAFTVSMDFAAFGFAKKLSKLVDTLFNIAFFNERIRPDLIENIVFCDKVSSPAYQKSEDLKGFLRGGINGTVVDTLDRSLVEIKAKTGEFVYISLFPDNTALNKTKKYKIAR